MSLREGSTNIRDERDNAGKTGEATSTVRRVSTRGELQGGERKSKKEKSYTDIAGRALESDTHT